MARDERALADIVERAAAVLSASGFPKMPARVLMSLTVAEDSLTAQELAERLGASAAAISGAVRYLETVGFVHRVSRPGERRARFELPANAWYGATLRKNPVFVQMAELSDRALEAIGDPTSPAARRTGEVGSFYRYIDQKMPELLRGWEEQSAAE